MAWQALPEEIRAEALQAVQDLIDLGLAQIPAIANGMASAVASGIGDAVPIIGALVEAVIEAIMAFVRAKKITEQHREDIAKLNRWKAQMDTLFNYPDPEDWVFKQMRCENWLDHIEGKEWREKPAFSRSSAGDAQLPFRSTKGLPDSGSCGTGLRWKCTGVWAPFDCEVDSDGEPCRRWTSVSALFYPYWSPSYAALPIPDKVGMTTDPNDLLIARQFALLSLPDANLRVDLHKAKLMALRFHNWFMDRAKKVGLSRVNTDGIAIPTLPDDRLLVEPDEIENYVPSQSDRRRFFVGEDSLIQTHPGADAIAADWGVPAEEGPQTPQNLMVTVAQHNTVVGSVLALVAARAAMLRRGPIMAALIQDHGIKAYDPRARAAMTYAAEVGTSIPAPVISGDLVLSAIPAQIPGEPPPARMPKKPGRLLAPREGGAGFALVAAAGLAAFALAKR